MTEGLIAENRKARHDYFFEEQLEAGLSLQGWEAKSIRAHRVQLSDSYIVIRKGEAYLLNTLITALPTASTHFIPEPTRSRKLLLHKREVRRLIGLRERDGYTLIPVKLYWKNNHVKVLVAVAKGKKEYDKRATEKERDWKRHQGQIMRRHTF
jgi:SsrA-binding protein